MLVLSILLTCFTLSRSVSNCLLNCNGGSGLDQIASLPGYSGYNYTQYSGLIQVNKTANGSLFYWFIESKVSPKTAPVLVWINGGPGASSMTGLLSENGPYRVATNTFGKLILNTNPYAWTNYYNLLFIDNPIGTGFSFCNDGDWVVNENQMAIQFVQFLDTFFSSPCHPEFANNGLYITGESYAGRYIPFIANQIVTTQNHPFSLKGLAIGNGIWDPYIQFRSNAVYAYNLGIIDEQQRDYVLNMVNICMPYTESPLSCEYRASLCENVTNDIYNSTMGNVFQYNVYDLNPAKFDEISDNIAAYLNQPNVREQIHVCDIPFKDSDGTSSPNPVSDALLCDIVYNNSAAFVPVILKAGVRIMFYNGQLDGSICNNYGNAQCLNQLNYQGNWYSREKIPYLTIQNNESLTAGYAKESDDRMLTYFVVSDSGHLVPYDQPYNILAVLKNWIDAGSWNDVGNLGKHQ